MLVQYPKTNEIYTPITELSGKNNTMLMNFGLINLKPSEQYCINDKNNESALLLMNGKVSLEWNNTSHTIKRNSLLDENPYALHVPINCQITIKAHTNAELALQQTKNTTHFDSVFYTPETIRSERFGDGVLEGTSTRIVRTIFDAKTAPYSQMVMGEVVNFPGRWSSYPPHNHPQPEVYHYRFFPEHGFGFGQAGDAVYTLSHKSTLMIKPWVVHPQTAAPGYAMYYIWMIPHLPNEKFGPDSRQFVEPHTWLLNDDIDKKVWNNEKQL